MIAPRHAAADLQIDETVADTIARHDLAQNDAKRGGRHRHADANFIERAFQAGEVSALVNQPAATHLANFVDGVSELVAAIIDMDLGVAERQIAAVDVGDARHRP
jgi:hypothetical protein